jgi:hypothetical protein
MNLTHKSILSLQARIKHYSSQPSQAMKTATIIENQNMPPRDNDVSNPVKGRRRAVHIGKIQSPGGDRSERTVATIASSNCSESNHDRAGQSSQPIGQDAAVTMIDSCTQHRLVDYSHHRAPLDRSSSYRIRRMSHRSLERAMTQPDRAAMLRQERRLSALKTHKRRFSKNATLIDDSVRSAPGTTTRPSLSASWSEGDNAPKVGSIDFYRVRLGMPVECAPKVKHEEPVVALQFAMKKKLHQKRETSTSLSPAPRQHRPPRKCRSTSDTMPRLPTRSASRRLLASTALDMVQEKQKVEGQDAFGRVQEQVVARKLKVRSSEESLQSQKRQQDDPSAGSITSAANSSSRSSNLRKKVGGIFKSMSLCKLKKYDQLQEEHGSDDLCVIQMPAFLCPPRMLRLESDDVSDCSSVSMEEDLDHDDEDEEESSTSYRLEDDDIDASTVGESVSMASRSRTSSSLHGGRDQRAGSSASLGRRRKSRSSRRRRLPSRWATTSLLDCSSARIQPGDRRHGSFTTTPYPTKNAFNANPGLIRYPTKIRRVTPSQA